MVRVNAPFSVKKVVTAREEEYPWKEYCGNWEPGLRSNLAQQKEKKALGSHRHGVWSQTCHFLAVKVKNTANTGAYVLRTTLGIAFATVCKTSADPLAPTQSKTFSCFKIRMVNSTPSICYKKRKPCLAHSQYAVNRNDYSSSPCGKG